MFIEGDVVKTFLILEGKLSKALLQLFIRHYCSDTMFRGMHDCTVWLRMRVVRFINGLPE